MSVARDFFWMQEAIQLAKFASDAEEVPVGAILIDKEGYQIGAGWNCPIGDCDPSAHAEIIALRVGAKAKKNYRLIDSTLYVTLEPCLMCIGAIVHARVKRVVFGAYDTKSGAVESAFQLGTTTLLNHKPVYTGGVLAQECGKLLSDFFKTRR